MKVFLDDCREAPDGWTLVHSALECITLLRSFSVDYLSLDHDLGDACSRCWRAPEDENDVLVKACATDCICDCHATGMDVVRFMASNEIWPAHKPTVHSMNVVGASNMRSMIDHYWMEPQ